MFDKRLLKEMPDAKSYIWKQVFCQWIALLMNIVLTLLICVLFIQLFDQQLSIEKVVLILLVMIVSLMIRAYVLKKATYYSFKGASLVKKTLRQRLFEKVLSLGSHYQDHVRTSELVQLSVEGINQLETYFSLYLPQLFYSVLAPVTLFVLTAFLDWKSALVLFVCVPLIPVSIIFVQKFAKKLLSKYWNSYTTLGDSFLENLQALTTLKIYQSDAYKQQQMNQEAENFRRITMRVLIMQLNSISIMDIVAYGGAGLGCFFAITHFQNQTLSLFGALFIVLMSFEFFIPLRQLGSFFHIAMNGIAASDKIFKILDLPVSSDGQYDLDASFDIRLEHVSFQYDDKRPILKDVSLHIQPHQFIGIVGESGSGKSTIAKLMMGYHRCLEGHLYMGEHQRSDIRDESFMEHVMYVTHDPMILKGTVRENLNMFSQYCDEQLWDVLKQVRLDGFFHEQMGLDTPLLENGSNLSGGQKQRLNLARALLKDVDVYIFDEATSNIDVESENHILNVIKTLTQTKTVIFITHRLQSVVHCDEIYVMQQGALVEQGTHQKLMHQEGIYHHMYQSQQELEVYSHE